MKEEKISKKDNDMMKERIKKKITEKKHEDVLYSAKNKNARTQTITEKERVRNENERV
jgi:hypothetical protein